MRTLVKLSADLLKSLEYPASGMFFPPDCFNLIFPVYCKGRADKYVFILKFQEGAQKP